jgi:hypothetical protein
MNSLFDTGKKDKNKKKYLYDTPDNNKSITTDNSFASNNIFLDQVSAKLSTPLNDFSEFERKLSVLKVAENMNNMSLSDMRDNNKMDLMINN